MSQRKIAAEVGCTKTGVNATIKQWKETGNVAERRGRKKKSNKPRRSCVSKALPFQSSVDKLWSP